MTRQSRNTQDQSETPIDLFRSIESKIAQREGRAPNDAHEINVTVDLYPTLEATPPTESVELIQGRYLVEYALGSGGMGAVYRAVDRSRSEYLEIDPHVAIKILHEEIRSQPEVLSKLRRQFYCAQALSHRSVIKVFELIEEPECSFFTMELIDGELLSGLMQKHHPMALPRAYVWSLIREIGEGLAHAHSRHVVHADVKPQNIMVTNFGELRILDFGGASGAAPAYASCELLEGQEAEPRDDLYSLACMAYELLAGEHPFQGKPAGEARALKLLPKRPRGLTRRQWKALAQGLSFAREARPATVNEWLALLNPSREPLGATPLRPNLTASRQLPGVSSSTRLVTLLALFIICFTAWVVLNRPMAQQAESRIAPEPDALTMIPAAANPALADSPTTDASQDDGTSEPLLKVVSKNHSAAELPAARPSDITEKIGISSAVYTVRYGQNFAEIHVRRSSASSGNTSFDWWTEPASAHAGVDYVPQSKSTMVFAPGVRSLSLFVKLMPNEARHRTNVFYVVIGNPSGGSTLDTVAKAAVKLAPSK